MPLSTGCHHAAIITKDLDRLIEFYTSHFDAEVQFDVNEGPMRHAMIDLGGFSLHPFQFPGDHSEAPGSANAFARGHIDHLAIRFDDPEAFAEACRRLKASEATDGTVVDFGMARVLQFEDPDGMVCEAAIWEAGKPIPLAEAPREVIT